MLANVPLGVSILPALSQHARAPSARKPHAKESVTATAVNGSPVESDRPGPPYDQHAAIPSVRSPHQ